MKHLKFPIECLEVCKKLRNTKSRKSFKEIKLVEAGEKECKNVEKLLYNSNVRK